MTCGLTACTPGSAPGPTLGIEYGKPLPFTFLLTYVLTLEPLKISPTPIKGTGPMDTYLMPANDFESSVHLYVHVPTRLLARMAF